VVLVDESCMVMDEEWCSWMNLAWLWTKSALR
jgi:hypothetical protein